MHIARKAKHQSTPEINLSLKSDFLEEVNARISSKNINSCSSADKPQSPPEPDLPKIHNSKSVSPSSLPLPHSSVTNITTPQPNDISCIGVAVATHDQEPGAKPTSLSQAAIFMKSTLNSLTNSLGAPVRILTAAINQSTAEVSSTSSPVHAPLETNTFGNETLRLVSRPVPEPPSDDDDDDDDDGYVPCMISPTNCPYDYCQIGTWKIDATNKKRLGRPPSTSTPSSPTNMYTPIDVSTRDTGA